QGADPDDRVGALRPRQRQPGLPAVHGPLRLRDNRQRLHVRLHPRALRDSQGGALLEVRGSRSGRTACGRSQEAPRAAGAARSDGEEGAARSGGGGVSESWRRVAPGASLSPFIELPVRVIWTVLLQ